MLAFVLLQTVYTVSASDQGFVRPGWLIFGQCSAALVALWLTLQHPREWRELGGSRFCRHGVAGLALAFVVGAAAQIPLAEFNRWLHEVGEFSTDRETWLENIFLSSDGTTKRWWFVAIAISGPITEELIFRGGLLFVWFRELPQSCALALSALLFGMVHVDVPTMVYASLCGVGLGTLAHLRQDLSLCIACHMGINSAPFVLATML